MVAGSSAGDGVALVDAAVIGAGAAGLFAAIFAGRACRAAGGEDSGGVAGRRGVSVVALDGARKLGAKILVAGGGRCNVTHYRVDEKQYAGSDPGSIKRVLRRFTVADTRRFFGAYGIELKQEETGKLFPTTDDGQTILDALLRAAREAPARLVHPWRVAGVSWEGGGASHPFVVHRDGGWHARGVEDAPDGDGLAGSSVIRARRVVLATGGKALPKTGSDGKGHAIARSLGHSITGRVFPSLVPLLLDGERSFAAGLSGIAVPATLEVRSGSGKVLKRFTNSLLCTHFGISGPAALDISRYYLDAAERDADVSLVVSWLPGRTRDEVDRALLGLGPTTVGRFLREAHGLPERLARALAEEGGVDASMAGHGLTREQRKRLAGVLTELRLPVTGDRGFTHAEVTAGGVPLDELDLSTMESRIVPGLHIVGELCDVDGRIGGFNFQWAWASGFVAGTALGGWLGGGAPVVRGEAERSRHESV